MDDCRAGDMLIDQSGSVLSITLNRPGRKNALTASMVRQIADSVAQANQDDQTRVIVLRAKGRRLLLRQRPRPVESPESRGRSRPLSG